MFRFSSNIFNPKFLCWNHCPINELLRGFLMISLIGFLCLSFFSFPKDHSLHYFWWLFFVKIVKYFRQFRRMGVRRICYWGIFYVFFICCDERIGFQSELCNAIAQSELCNAIAQCAQVKSTYSFLYPQTIQK